MDGLVLLVPFGLLVGSWVIGRSIEQRHYASLRDRERQQRLRPAVSLRHVPDGRPVARTALALGSVVVSADYFKSFVASFRKLVGGELRAYSSVIDRARREAVLRMKESCPDAHLFLNFRLQTTEVGGGGGNRIPIVEIIAYATAVTFAEAPADEVRPPGSG
jgi:uncharacterized protein YbjQ (UPF0145 family)